MTSTPSPHAPCVVCGAMTWLELPTLAPASMASDWRRLDAPLRHYACRACGLVRAGETPAGLEIFGAGYALYAHPPGDDAREAARHEEYADWLAGILGGWAPPRVLDIGCGNGSLLRALGRRWPAARLLGCDVSPGGVRHGRDAGLMLWEAAPSDLPPDIDADLVLAVNVIEHVDDPVSFLRAVRRRVRSGGLAVIVCPDGAAPSVDLLIADHRHSFERPHLECLARRAGLVSRTWSCAPASLGPFQMLVMERGVPADAHAPRASAARLRAKANWLRHWAALDRRLLARLAPGPVICFGVGEAAGLLRAYTPRVWARVHACTADDVRGARAFGDLPVVSLDDVGPDRQLLVGVRPQDQPVVAHRLAERGHRVVTWYDLVTTPQS
jgi:SAM-dependent methyltransferase